MNTHVEIATLRVPAAFDDKTHIVVVGPIPSLPSGHIRINFNPCIQSAADAVARANLIRQWPSIQSITVGSVHNPLKLTYDVCSFRNIGMLHVDSCDLQELMGCSGGGNVYFEFHMRPNNQ